MKNKNTLSGTSALVKQEAERFLLNAAEIFSTKGKLEDGYFSDKKYVKMASHAAYTGVLYALDAALKLPKKNRNDIREYYKALSVENKKMNKHFEYLYATFHLD